MSAKNRRVKYSWGENIGPKMVLFTPASVLKLCRGYYRVDWDFRFVPRGTKAGNEHRYVDVSFVTSNQLFSINANLFGLQSTV